MSTITEIIETSHARNKIPFSVEIFPPKGELTLDAAREMVNKIGMAEPDFISVTCSAGGSGNANHTINIASAIQHEASISSVAHLTCVSATHENIEATIEEMKAAGVKNVLALRGDVLEGQEPADFYYAHELIPILKDAGFCVGAAAYPEGHIDCISPKDNIAHLKEKQEAGADFFITQLFFDNEIFYRFRDQAAAAGITVPISCGIMPFLGKSQIQRMVFMCGASLPAAIIKLLAKYENNPAFLRSAGIEYACKQLVDLGKNDVDALHVYSMNHPDIAVSAAVAISLAELR